MSSDDLPANVLFEWYGRYIGDPDAETDVYLGFALFFGGIALGAVGVVVFLLSAALGSGGQPLWALREVAVVAAAGGFPILLLGIVTLLPGDRRMLYVATGGIAVCLVALALFVYAYPYYWNVDGTDYSAQGVAVYAVGLVAIMGSTAAALVGHQVERAAGPAGGADAADGEGSGAPDGAKSDAEDPDAVSAQARRDVEEAMAGADISWGGVEKRETKRLKLNTPDMGEVSGNVDSSSAKTTRASGSNVDDAVAAMQGLKGGNKDTASGGGTDDQAAALRELREQQQAEEIAEADGPVEKVKANGLVDGLRQYFGGK